MSHQRLRQDLLTLQSSIRDILGKSKKIQVPSWKYPEKLAADVDVESTLKDSQNDVDDNAVLLLELVVDRMQLLFQLFIWQWHSETRAADSSSSLPLTLSTAVKKFCKMFSQMQRASRRSQAELTDLRDKTTKLEQTINRLQEQCTIYRDILEPPWTGTDGAKRPITRMVCDLKSSSDSRVLSRSIPPANMEPSKTTQPVGIAARPARLRVMSGGDKDPIEKRDVSVQTYNTSLSLCVKCAELSDNFLKVSEVVSTLCSRLNLDSSIPYANQLLTTPGMSKQWLGKLVLAIRADVLSVGEAYVQMKKVLRNYHTDLEAQKEKMRALEERCSILSQQVLQVLVDLEKAQKEGQVMVEKNDVKHKEQLKVVKETLEKEQFECERVKKEMVKLRRLEAELNFVQAKKDKEISSIQSLLQEAHGTDAQLRVVKEKLQQQLAVLQVDHKAACQLVEEKTVQLKKTTSLLHNTEKRFQSLQSSHGRLLTQVDELDNECNQLKHALTSETCSRQELEERLTLANTNLGKLEKVLEVEKVSMAKIQSDKSQLLFQCSQLQHDVAESKEQLLVTEQRARQQESNCQLLMDTPYLGCSEREQEGYPNSLSLRQSQQLITANTIRIMLLEKQNSELRNRIVADASRSTCTSSSSRQDEFTQPIRLWQDFDVMKMEGKRLRESLKSKSGTHLDHPSPVRPRFYSAGASSELPKSTRTNIAQVPKPLGRDPSHMTMSLVSSDSQGMQTDCIPATPHSTPHHIEAWLTSCEEGSRRQQLLKTYFCNNCEQMFCLESSLEEHLQSCCSS